MLLEGWYHLFYQAYPKQDPRQHWGHAISKDLVNWRDLPLAIYPDIEWGCFSGTTLVEENRVIAMYHGRKVGNMIAVSSDPLLLNWKKDVNCPVIPLTPDSDDGKPYRVFDPCIWKEDDGYYSLSGCFYGKEDERNTGQNNRMVEHLFFSQDLSRWTYLGELADDFPQIPAGNDGACPYFLPLSDQHALFFFSHQTGPHILVGEYDKVLHKFYPNNHLRLCNGPVGCSSIHAPSAMADSNGGAYVIYNTKDANKSLERQGAMTIAQNVTWQNGEINIKPVDAIDSLRKQNTNFKTLSLGSFEEYVLPVNGKELDIQVSYSPIEAHPLMIKLFRSPDGRQYTSVTIYPFCRKRDGRTVNELLVTADTLRASRLKEVHSRPPETTTVAIDLNEKVNLRILVDRSIIEIFINSKSYIMQMVYPDDDSCGISLESLSSQLIIDNIDIWSMGSIYD